MSNAESIKKHGAKTIQTILVNEKAGAVTVVATHDELTMDTVKTVGGEYLPVGARVKTVKTVEIAKVSGEDEFDPYVGAALAIAYQMFGSRTAFRKFVDKTATFVGADGAKKAEAKKSEAK